MGLVIVALVLTSAVMHPLWNLLLKKNPDPQLGYLVLTATMGMCALAHGLVVGVDFSAALMAWPLIAASVCGQIIYGTCLTATLSRGDLSTYYPIIRSSPVFIVVVSIVLFGQTYPWTVLLGIAMAVTGGFLLLYRRGSRILDDRRSLALALLAMCGTGIYSLADAGSMRTIEPQVLVVFVEGPLVFFYGAVWLRRKPVTTLSTPRSGGFSWAHVILPGVLAYSSYYLILIAYQLGGDVAAVTSMRQASIPISVLLGGLFLREGAMLRRLFAAGLLALGIVVIALSG
ncbi:hypothetical protein [Roseovarius sp. 2305UL8-3]|uniref:hypothetical protein n=1 Tax=Roseovarius conchicola TaxID=3121636 RepID=UPI0035279FF8